MGSVLKLKQATLPEDSRDSSLTQSFPPLCCRVLVRPLVYTVSALLPVAYIIGLTFTLKTHSHIYDIHVGEEQGMYLKQITAETKDVRL